MRRVAVAAIAACGAPQPASTLATATPDVLRAHAWQLWAQLATADPPAWDAWTPTEQLFGAPVIETRPRFRTPRPFRHGDALERETLPVMFDVLFDPAAAAHVRTQHLGERTHLDALAALPAFPRESVAVKLVWYAVHAHGLTAMPIWDAEPTQPDADGNADRSWRRAVAVDPSEHALDGSETADVELEGRRLTAHVVPLAAFVHRELATADEVATARTAAHDPTLQRGDFVALVAVHLTTKEIPDWTWETYWWHDRPDAGAYAAGRPALAGAAAHYLMDATVSTDAPCFNPWLEARFPGGLHSNCVTCHQRAVVGAADYLPVTRGRLRDDDAYFRGHVPTDFVWSIAFEAR
jgi:hypothetical protein